MLVAWVTTSDSTEMFGPVSSETETSAPTPTPSPSVTTTAPTDQSQGADADGGLTETILIVFYVVLAVFAAGLLWLLIGKAATRQRRRRRRSEFEASDLEDLDVAAKLNVSLTRTVGERLSEMHEGSARNAIVRCWLDLEDAVTDAGFPRDPALTSLELTQQVMARYAVDPDSIRTLAGLFREARFSAHDLTESHRVSAIDALQTLQDQLRSRQEAAGVGQATKQAAAELDQVTGT